MSEDEIAKAVILETLMIGFPHCIIQMDHDARPGLQSTLLTVQAHGRDGVPSVWSKWVRCADYLDVAVNLTYQELRDEVRAFVATIGGAR